MPIEGFPWIDGTKLLKHLNTISVQVAVDDRNGDFALRLRNTIEPAEIVIYLDKHLRIKEVKTYES